MTKRLLKSTSHLVFGDSPEQDAGSWTAFDPGANKPEMSHNLVAPDGELFYDIGMIR